MERFTIAVLVGFGLLLIALLNLGRTYQQSKDVDRRRRYADLGAKMAERAGFRLESYSEGNDGLHPSYTFYYGNHPHRLVLHITDNGWRTFEPRGETQPEPKYREQHGDELSIDDFRDAAGAFDAALRLRHEHLGTTKRAPSIELNAQR